jgi:hypothetical protein
MISSTRSLALNRRIQFSPEVIPVEQLDMMSLFQSFAGSFRLLSMDQLKKNVIDVLWKMQGRAVLH